MEWFNWVVALIVVIGATYLIKRLRRVVLSPRNKYVLITGAGSGLGAASAKRLIKEGAVVIAVDINLASLKETFAGLPNVHTLQCDVTKPEDVEAMRVEVEKILKAKNATLFGLVNNAGIAHKPIALVDLSESEMQSVLGVNLFGVWRTTKALFPLLDFKGERGMKACIVNMSSLAGRSAHPFMGAYNMSKFGVEAFSDTLRRELINEGIRVVALEPYFAQTNIVKAAVAPDEESRKTMRSSFVQGIDISVHTLSTKVKMMTPEFVAEAVQEALFDSAHPYHRPIAMPVDLFILNVLIRLPDYVVDWLIGFINKQVLKTMAATATQTVTAK